MYRKLMMVFTCLLLVGTMFVPLSQAGEWNKKTIFTFNEPVEVPGAVLPAGKYVFKLADSDSDRDIVQVFNADESKIFATILAIPDYRMKTPDKTIVTFDERPKDSPEAVRAWFYPGDNYGIEFVYPKERATVLAKANNRPVLAHHAPAQAQAAQLKAAPVNAINPAGTEVQLTEVIASAAPPAARLPHTASSLPLLAMLGMFSLGLGLALPRLARVICS